MSNREPFTIKIHVTEPGATFCHLSFSEPLPREARLPRLPSLRVKRQAKEDQWTGDNALIHQFQVDLTLGVPGFVLPVTLLVLAGATRDHIHLLLVHFPRHLQRLLRISRYFLGRIYGADTIICPSICPLLVF